MNDSRQLQAPVSGKMQSERRCPPLDTKKRRIPLVIGLGTMTMIGIAVGVGATLYHSEMMDFFDSTIASDSANAQDSASEVGKTAPPGSTDVGVEGQLADTAQSVVQRTMGTTGRGGSTPFVHHTEEAGIEACANLYAVLGESLTGGASYGVQSFWNKQMPNDHAIEGIVSLNYQNESYASAAAGYVFASPTDKGCAGTMVRIAPYQRTCSEIPAILPEGSTQLNDLGDVAAYQLSTGGQALLLPVGGSCAVVSIASGAQVSKPIEGVQE
ncbi:MAG: hypothetical protein ACPW61_08300 [Methyloligella sp. ZOD6]